MKLPSFFVLKIKKEGIKMNKNIILTELIRKLPEVEDVFYEMKDDKLHVYIENNGGFDVRQSGGITTYENDSLYYGHYYGNNYSGAKEDFATRSGLMNEDRVFTNDELFSISRCLEDTLNGGYELDYDEQETLKDLFERIKNVIPDYKERCITLDEQDNQEMNNSEFDMSM